jgi:glucose/mannose transport system substrate-binding protein
MAICAKKTLSLLVVRLRTKMIGRKRLFLLLMILVPTLSACLPPGAPAKAPDKRQLEVFSWWTGGGEAAGLDAMIRIFSQENPDIRFINAAVAGGGGTNARAVLATRLQAGNPPDSWQGHAGQELIGTYVKGNQLEPLNFLYKQNNWLAVMPKNLIPLISQDGNIYSVPVNIHRANMLWYNPSILAAHHLPVPVTLEQWFSDMDALQASGMSMPLAMGEQWTAFHLFETILLSTLGPTQYSGLWNGSTAWAGPSVTQAIENYKKVLTYANNDASSLTWQEASQLVVNGDAAFNVMGDWVDGYYRELKKEPLKDYGWTPVPGTAGTFEFLSDSFILPVGAKHRQEAIAWLTLAGSREGQDAFNPLKGSIPARGDVDRDLYSIYSQSAMDEWATDQIVGSIYHGVVANDSWKNDINDAIGLFLIDKKTDSFQTDLLAACRHSGPCR